MSVEQAKAFIEKMKTDEAFRAMIMAIETPEERLKAIGAAGFECTGEEINEAGYGGGAQVTGGYGLPFIPPDFCWFIHSIEPCFALQT